MTSASGTPPSDRTAPAAGETGCADGGVDCAEVLAELQRFLDGEITTDEVQEVREHLAACYPCADRADFERQFRLLIRSRCEDELAPPGLADRIRACLDEAGSVASEG